MRVRVFASLKDGRGGRKKGALHAALDARRCPFVVASFVRLDALDVLCAARLG